MLYAYLLGFRKYACYCYFTLSIALKIILYIESMFMNYEHINKCLYVYKRLLIYTNALFYYLLLPKILQNK